MDLTRSLDIYCERVGAAFWAEPVNALTNLAFVAAAVIAWRRASQGQGLPDRGLQILADLSALVGLGSFLFHTFAQAWSAAADVLTIWLFALGYTFICLNRLFGLGPVKVLAGILALAAAGYFGLLDVAGAWRALGLPSLGGGARYLLAVVALAGLALALAIARNRAWPFVFAGALLFAVSLTFRTLDGPLCADFPLGTHFLWHVFNGGLFALLLIVIPVRQSGKPGAAL